MLIPYLWCGHQKHFPYLVYNLAIILFMTSSSPKADLKVVPDRLATIMLVYFILTAFGCFNVCNYICIRHSACYHELDLTTPLVVISLTSCCPGNLIPSNVKLQSSNTRIRVHDNIKTLRIVIRIHLAKSCPLCTPYESRANNMDDNIGDSSCRVERFDARWSVPQHRLIVQFRCFLAVQTLYLKVVSSSPESYAGYDGIV